jgi:hypothetical protein
MGKPDKRQYDNQGRDQINIENILLQSQETLRSRVEQELLETVRKLVKSRLAGQLHHAVKLNLQKEMQPEQVRPWSMAIKVAIEQPNQVLPPDTTIEEVFDRCSGRLLILGEPGAGKSTSLLDLTLELIIRAENDSQQRVPIVVDLSDWQPVTLQTTSILRNFPIELPWRFPENSFSAWLAVKVQKTYGFSTKKIEKLLAERRLIPLLDGLDEIRPEYQQDCVWAIKQWLNSDSRPRQLALCCRREQYENYSEKLELDVGGAVYLQDLADEQIKLFLSNVNRAELWESLKVDDNLLSLIRRPLLLSMAVVAYEKIDRIKWQQSSSAEDRINLLLDAYVQQMLTQNIPSHAYHKGTIPSYQQSQKWLEVLALQLLKGSETDFFVERLQPTWLTTSTQRNLYILTSSLIYGLQIGFFFLFYKSIATIVFGVVYFCFLAFSEYSDLNNNRAFRMGNSIKISRLLKPKIWFGLLTMWILLGLPILTILKILIVFFCVDINENNEIAELITIMLFLSVGIIHVFLASVDDIFILSEQKIKKSIFSEENYFLLIPVFILIQIFIWNFTGQRRFPVFLVVFLLGFFHPGGRFIIKLSLFLTNFAPKPNDYDKFLNYATERLLLQRVGKRYRFIHDLLRQFFAQRRIETHPHLFNAQSFTRCGESFQMIGQYDTAVCGFVGYSYLQKPYSVKR